MNHRNWWVVGALAFAFASTAQAHARLDVADPKAGSLLNASPKQIRLQFSEMLEPAFSRITLVGADERLIALSGIDLDKANPKAVIAGVPPLPAGQYRVRWTAAGHDGHVTRGELSFRVR